MTSPPNLLKTMESLLGKALTKEQLTTIHREVEAADSPDDVENWSEATFVRLLFYRRGKPTLTVSVPVEQSAQLERLLSYRVLDEFDLGDKREDILVGIRIWMKEKKQGRLFSLRTDDCLVKALLVKEDNPLFAAGQFANEATDQAQPQPNESQ